MKMLSTMKLSRELVCILSLSLSFMLLFAADGTMLNMQKTVVSSIAQEKPDFHVEGYTVTGVSFTVFAIALWFGPYLNYALGAKLTMTLSAIGYLFYVVSYVLEDEWVIYAAAVVQGLAAGTLWPAQGHYMIGNSSPETTGRNAAIFWFFFMISNMVGNIFVYISFRGKKYINQDVRRTAIYFLVGINVIAILALMILPKSISKEKATDYGPIKTIKKSWKILTSYKMLWLTLTFLYTGLQQSFWTGIYSPSIGFTLGFGDNTKELVALSGIFMSFGGLVGAFCPLVLSGWVRRHGYARRLIVLSGCVAQLVAYLITFINLPNSAVFGNTDQQSLIQPSVALAMIGSVLLTFGDSCYTTQIFSIVGEFYRESSAEGCALYKFVKSASVAMSFYWCSHLGLHTQAMILAVAAAIGTLGFFVADHNNVSHPVEEKPSEDPPKICKISLPE